MLPLSALEGVKRSWGQTQRYLAISRNTKASLPCQPTAKLPGGKVQAPGKALQLKEDFWLRHLFQYQKEDQFILTPSEFQQTDLWEFLTWESQGDAGAHGRDVGHPASSRFAFLEMKKRFKNIKKLICSAKGRPKLSQQGRQDIDAWTAMWFVKARSARRPAGEQEKEGPQELEGPIRLEAGKCSLAVLLILVLFIFWKMSLLLSNIPVQTLGKALKPVTHRVTHTDGGQWVAGGGDADAVSMADFLSLPSIKRHPCRVPGFR